MGTSKEIKSVILFGTEVSFCTLKSGTEPPMGVEENGTDLGPEAEAWFFYTIICGIQLEEELKIHVRFSR